MKNLIIGSAMTIVLLSACSNDNNKPAGDATSGIDTTQTKSLAKNNEASTTGSVDEKASTSLKNVLSGYLQVKNALADDNGKDAASGGNVIVEALGKFDKSGLTVEQKKTYEDVADDAKEMAEHIGMNAGKIEHQREHFDMLSKDMYDLVKEFGAGQPLFQDFCPMYNDKKGATWISETKEVKNPYLGKKMPACGSVKEEIKQ